VGFFLNGKHFPRGKKVEMFFIEIPKSLQGTRGTISQLKLRNNLDFEANRQISLESAKCRTKNAKGSENIFFILDFATLNFSFCIQV